MESRLLMRLVRDSVEHCQAQAVATQTTQRVGIERSRERASHHGIGGNLRRASRLVNGYGWIGDVWIQAATECYLVNEAGV
jgi:hypothetical protein